MHALLGENGAGKSTLIKILTGSYQADEGTLAISGEEVRLADPHDAQRHGIALVPQDVLVVPELSIGRNILMGREGVLVRKSALSAAEHDLVQQALDQVGADFGPDDPGRPAQRPPAPVRADRAGPGHRLCCPGPGRADRRAQRARRCESSRASAGGTGEWQGHRLRDAPPVRGHAARRPGVGARNGRLVGTFAQGDFTREKIVDLLTKTKNRPVAHIGPQEGLAPHGQQVRLLARGISDGARLHDIDLEVRPGQIVGVAGVQGSGHGQLAKVLAGLAPATGSLTVDGEALPLGRPGTAFDRGIILVPADRRNAAIVGPLSILDNLAISRRIRPEARRFGLRWSRQERKLAGEYVKRLAIKAPSIRTPVGVLSGGNQQKVALSRALEGNAHVLLVEEPTQGIDIDAKEEVRQLLREFAAAGGAVVVATSEFEELIDLADEAVVLHAGRVSGRLAREDITYRNILSLALD